MNNNERITDQSDQATVYEEFFTSLALRNMPVVESMESNGECLNCGEITNNRFCCIECRDEYQEYQIKLNKLTKTNGR